MKVVLFSDRSGVFGHWEKNEFDEWRFKRKIDVDHTEEDMKYLLKELKKIKKLK